MRKLLNAKEDLRQKVMKRNLDRLDYIARMDNSRKNKSVLMGTMNGDNGRGRSCREWLDDIKEWCQKDIHLLSKIAREQNKWRQVVKCSLVTYKLSAHR